MGGVPVGAGSVVIGETVGRLVGGYAGAVHLFVPSENGIERREKEEWEEVEIRLRGGEG